MSGGRTRGRTVVIRLVPPTRAAAIARSFLVAVGALCVLYLLLRLLLFAAGWGQYQLDGDAIECPSKRYAVVHAVIVHPSLEFGLVMFDRETDKQGVVAGWSGGQWCKEIKWTADDRLRIEHFEQNSLRWGRRTELLGVKIDWVLVSRTSK